MIRVVIVDVLQADQMVRPKWYKSAQMQTLNLEIVMILIPFNNLVLYPALRRWGIDVTPLRRTGFGIAVRRAMHRRSLAFSGRMTE